MPPAGTCLSLTMHKRAHTGEKPYSCDICEREFGHMNNLITHKGRHAGEKPYACTICEKQFASMRIIIQHRTLHVGEKCAICEKKFGEKSQLSIQEHILEKNRMYVTHVEKTLLTRVCGSCNEWHSRI